MGLFAKYNVSRKDKIYIILAVISLVMYIFGHSTEWGKLPFPDKFFYLPCALTLLVAITSKKYWVFSKEDKIFIAFWIIMFLNTLLVAEIQIEVIFNSVMGFLIFRYLMKINYRPLLFFLVYLTPFVIAIHYVFSTPFSMTLGYRYGGFQGDPNCFSFAMNVLIFACCYVLNNRRKTWEVMLSLTCIIGIFPLMIAAASRSGVAIMILLLTFTLKDILIKNKVLALVILAIGALFGGKYVMQFSTQIETVANRFLDTKGSDEDYRAQEWTMVPDVLLAHPKYILLGIGYSESLNAHSKFPEYYHEGRSHNTYMSVLLEEGIIGFVLFLLFLKEKILAVWRSKQLADSKLMRIMLFSTLFFIYTIYSLPFLPFWFIINIISNTEDNKVAK